MAMPNTLNAGVITGVVVSHSGVVLMARVLGNLGQPITQASISSIAYGVWDLNAGVVLGTGTFSVVNSVYNSLIQNDPRWTRDSAAFPNPVDGAWGYNWIGTLPAATFPAAVIQPAARPYPVPQPKPNRIHVEVAFTPVTGEIFGGVWEWTPIQRFS